MSGLLIPPDLGRIASFGRWTSWRWISLVSLARRESFPFWSLPVYPLVSVGTMKPRMVRGSLMSPVLAQMIDTVAWEPLVIHILVPLSTQPSLVSRAVVIMA